jgi:hypothetical protein
VIIQTAVKPVITSKRRSTTAAASTVFPCQQPQPLLQLQHRQASLNDQHLEQAIMTDRRALFANRSVPCLTKHHSVKATLSERCLGSNLSSRKLNLSSRKLNLSRRKLSWMNRSKRFNLDDTSDDGSVYKNDCLYGEDITLPEIDTSIYEAFGDKDLVYNREHNENYDEDESSVTSAWSVPSDDLSALGSDTEGVTTSSSSAAENDTDGLGALIQSSNVDNKQETIREGHFDALVASNDDNESQASNAPFWIVQVIIPSDYRRRKTVFFKVFCSDTPNEWAHLENKQVLDMIQAMNDGSEQDVKRLVIQALVNDQVISLSPLIQSMFAEDMLSSSKQQQQQSANHLLMSRHCSYHVYVLLYQILHSPLKYRRHFKRLAMMGRMRRFLKLSGSGAQP